MALLAAACTMSLPETGGEILADTLEEGEDFGKGQSFVHVLFIERRRKKHRSEVGKNEIVMPSKK